MCKILAKILISIDFVTLKTIQAKKMLHHELKK